MCIRDRFEEDTELTGYMKLHAFVEADGHDDMDLFVTVKKVHENGTEIPVTLFDGTAPHPGAWGKMRVSHRELDAVSYTHLDVYKRQMRL